MEKIVERENSRFVTETRFELQREQPCLIEGKSKDEVESEIQVAMKRGQIYGIQAYRDLFRFIVIQLTFGAGFEDVPMRSHIKEILQDDYTDPTVKVLQIEYQINN